MSTAAPALGRSGVGSEQALNWALRVIRLGPALILIALMAILSLASPFFLTGDNISNVAVQVAPLACLAVGQLFVILVGGIDLSVGSLLALCTVTGALAYGWGDIGGALVIPMMLLTGMAVGALNGIMLVKGHMPHAFIPTLATLNAARGLALLLSDGAPMPGMPGLVRTIGSGEVGPIPVAVLVVAGFALLAWILATRLQWGRWIYLVGADKEAARRMGIPVDRVIISVFIISGLGAGLAGLITAGPHRRGLPVGRRARRAGRDLRRDHRRRLVLGRPRQRRRRDRRRADLRRDLATG